MILVLSLHPVRANGQISARNGDWQLSLERTEQCEDCVGGERFYLQALKGAGEPVVFPILSAAYELIEISLYDNYGIVRGSLPYGGFSISIVDLVTQETVDQLNTYRADVFANGRYVVFEKHYPRMLPAESGFFLYDIQYAREMARLSGIRSPGIQIYPKGEISPDHGYFGFTHFHWDEGRRILILAMNSENDGLSLLRLSIGDSLAALSRLNPCQIDVLPAWPDVDRGRRLHPNYGVKAFSVNHPFVELELQEVRGITGHLKVGYEYQCVQ